MTIPIDVDEVRRLLDEGAQLVETLPQPSYAREHLPGAINLPLIELDRRAAATLDRSKPVIVYCYDGL
jgi:rhodanese-related sulfurtransferase